MIILVLDPGISTGYCLVKTSHIDVITILEDELFTEQTFESLVQVQKADIYEYGLIHVDISSKFQGDHCLNLMEQVQEIITSHKVDHLVVENYFYTSKFTNQCNTNVALRAAIYMVARKNHLEYSMVNVSSWKHFVAGHARPTKAQEKKWGARSAKKLFIQEALREGFHIGFPTNKKALHDIVDAVGQAVYYCGSTLGISRENISCNVINYK